MANRSSQLGFRDDTSYLTAHYGRRHGSGQHNYRSPQDGRVFSNRAETTDVSTALSRCERGPVEPLPMSPSSGKTGTEGTPTSARLLTGPSDRRVVRSVAWGSGKTPAGARAASVRRPTLSEQLASIGKSADEVTASIRRTHGLKPLEGAVLTTPSESFFVGKLKCKYPSPVHFFKHKCVYTFHHPFEATRITMEMFFRDMRSATLECSKRQLLFKIDHQLRHYSGDYSWDDPSHFVVIQFSSDLDARAVAREVLPLIQRACIVPK